MVWFRDFVLQPVVAQTEVPHMAHPLNTVGKQARGLVLPGRRIWKTAWAFMVTEVLEDVPMMPLFPGSNDNLTAQNCERHMTAGGYDKGRS